MSVESRIFVLVLFAVTMALGQVPHVARTENVQSTKEAAADRAVQGKKVKVQVPKALPEHANEGSSRLWKRC